MGGASLKTSIAEALSLTYPEYPWIPWKFRSTESQKNDHAKMFMDMVAKQLNIINLNDWYSVQTEKLRSFEGGDRILSMFNNSLLRILTAAYPDHGWLSHKFSHERKFIINNWKLFFDFVSRELKIKEMSDWYQVTAEVANSSHFLLIK